MRRILPPLLVLFLALGGCLPRRLERVASGDPLPAAPLGEALARYNREPRAVRVQGRLRVEGQGSAVFGATADADRGLRLDAVSGPFSRLVLSLACRVGAGCEAYLPSRRVLLLQPPGSGDGWLIALARGRLPTLGEPAVAWQLVDGSRVLQLVGEDGWIEEVEFPAGDDRPRRAVFSRAGNLQLEVLLGEYREVGGQPFPGEIQLRSAVDGQVCGFEFLQVLTADGVAPEALHLNVPPDTVTERVEGNGKWSTMVLPPWTATPGR